jgi:hypothetical protein
MSYTYYQENNNFYNDLSNADVIDDSNPPLFLGEQVLINHNGTKLFISSLKTINNIHGEVFEYSYNNGWNFEGQFYSTSSVSSTHTGGSDYPAKFGNQLCCSYDGNILVVGTPEHRNNTIVHGSVSIFKYTTSWIELQHIVNSNVTGFKFGSSLCCNKDGTRIFVGTSVDQYTLSNVFLYEYNSSTSQYDLNSTFSSDIKPELGSNGPLSNYGNNLDCDEFGNVLIVGSDNFYRSINGNTRYPGTAHLITYDGTNWSNEKDFFEDISNNRTHTVTGTELNNASLIGQRVKISDDASHIFISTGVYGNTGGSKGEVFYFKDINGNYEFQDTFFISSNTTSMLHFGYDIHLNNDTLVISTNGFNVYIYKLISGSWTLQSQNILNSVLSSHYISSSSADNFGNSLTLSGDSKYLGFGAKSYKYTGSSITGQAFVFRGKELQTITMNDITGIYATTSSLSSSTSGISIPSPTYTNENNSVLYSINGSNITFNSLGTASLRVNYESTDDYESAYKDVNVTINKASQVIDYTAAITTQGYIGIGQLSGLSFNSLHSLTNLSTQLYVTTSITGNSISYNPISNEVEGVQIGISELTLSQSGTTFYNAATNIVIQYDVQSQTSGANPTTYNENGLILVDVNELPEMPTEIVDKIAMNILEKSQIGNRVTYSIPLKDSEENKNNLKRTKFTRQEGLFHFEIKELDNSIDYTSVTLKAIEELGSYPINSIDQETVTNLQNNTDIIRIDKYLGDNGNYIKSSDDYVTIKILHPYDTLVMYHIDEVSGIMLEVNTVNFPNSSIVREFDGSNYWFVRMPFSVAVGGSNVGDSDPFGNGDSDPFGNITLPSEDTNICFLKGTEIKCFVDNKEIDISIENIKEGTLVKTTCNGYIPVKKVYNKYVNIDSISNKGDRIYKYSKHTKLELTNDLFVTGYHCILKDELSNIEETNVINTLGKVFITDKKYRLPSMIDKDAELYIYKGVCHIWNICLEHSDQEMNYGIYANGLLVESCCEKNINKHLNK